jgi:hypothetical protein
MHFDMIRFKIKFIVALIFLLTHLGYDCYCQQQDTTVFVTVDSVPQFRYKDCKDTKDCVDLYISEHLIWPSDNNTYAKVQVQCIVEKDGTLSNFKIVHCVEEWFDKAAIDIVKSMPKWKSGSINHRIVRTKIVIPVVWNLNEK